MTPYSFFQTQGCSSVLRHCLPALSTSEQKSLENNVSSDVDPDSLSPSSKAGFDNEKNNNKQKKNHWMPQFPQLVNGGDVHNQ